MHRIQIRQDKKKLPPISITISTITIAAKKWCLWRLLTGTVSGTSAAAEWCKENLKWAAGQAALDFRGPDNRDMAALRGPQPSYPAQILQFQMSTQS